MAIIRRAFAWLGGLGLQLLLTAAASAQTEITVVRGDEQYPPFEMVVDAQLTGLHIELVTAVAGKLGLGVKWESLPWKRALRMVEMGQAHAVTYIARTPEREAWAVFLAGNVLTSSEIRFIVLKERAAEVTYDGQLARFLATRRPIVVRGFAFGSEELDGIKKLAANNMQDLLRMLKAGHSELAVVNWGDFVGAFKGRPELAAVQPLSPPVRVTQNYIAFALKDGALASRFAAAMSDYKNSPQYSALLARYQIER